MDAEGNVEYAPQDLQGNERSVFTDHRGQYPQFQIPESVPAALLVAPPYMQRVVPLETLQGASQAITELERLTISNIDRGPDGRLVFAAGTGTVPITRNSSGRLVVTD